MIFKTITAGPFQANNYLLIDEISKKAVLIDASGDLEAVKKYLDEAGATLEKVLLTHAHIDHIAGCYELQEKLGVKVFMHKDDKFLVDNLKQQLQMFGLPEEKEPQIDGFIEDGEIITVGDMNFKAIHTPGHSKGGLCYQIGNMLFSGDTLFAQSVGRTDLPGGDYEVLEKSITEKLFTLDDDLVVLPGHGGASMIGQERRTNPFFGQESQIV